MKLTGRNCLNPFEIRAELLQGMLKNMTQARYCLNPFEIRAELLREALRHTHGGPVLIPLKSGLSYYDVIGIEWERQRS